MNFPQNWPDRQCILIVGLSVVAFFVFVSIHNYEYKAFADDVAPVPLLNKNNPVDWWFVFKFNSATFPECVDNAERMCIFGGEVQPYSKFSQQYIYASSKNPSFKQGSTCLGDTVDDPVGATFDEIYNGTFYYVIWNDQFYDNPKIQGCSKSCKAPWGHSKGVVAWNSEGDGLVMQVTTPSWPASGSKNFPRENDGNTLGCIDDNDVKVSQHFFALKLNEEDLIKVLKALQDASVVTDPNNPQIVKNGGPEEVQELVRGLGVKNGSTQYLKEELSSGVELISKPSKLNVPPWQMVSAILGGVSLRTATWWTNPKICTTTTSTNITCWSDSLGQPGRVEIAESGHWAEHIFSLKGGPSPNSNHAKIGVSKSGNHHYTIFGDLNQQGSISGNCSSSQNGRGGLFFIMKNDVLYISVENLIIGDTAPTQCQ
jgi:hypothetical protein